MNKFHIFTSHGHTFTFHDADIININETILKITYVAQSDGVSKEALFFTKNIVGYSRTIED
jgi:hypothetical protein